MIEKIFKWKTKQFIQAILSTIVFSISIKLFVTPNHLYNGGILGVSQLLKNLIVDNLGVNVNFDVTAILYYLLNIPLFLMAYKKISKTFFARTLFAVTLQTIVLNIIPTPSSPIVDDILTNVLMAGLIDGVGLGMLLSVGASSGGTDILGVALANKNRKYSVGSIGLIINVIIYSISGILYGVPIMIYSIILSAIASFMVDHTHEQNICSNAFIFTKTKPKKISKFIKEELDRDVTYWDAYGGYDNSKTYIIYTVLSKYELLRLERHLPDLDANAFLVKEDGIKVNGNFKKKI